MGMAFISGNYTIYLIVLYITFLFNPNAVFVFFIKSNYFDIL